MSPVMLMDECPSKSDTALMCTPESNHAVAAEWRNVWTPTLPRPAFCAANSTVRRMLRGSTGVPNSGGEHQTRGSPLIPGPKPLRGLTHPLRLQQQHHRGGQRHRAPGPLRLRLSEKQLPPDAAKGCLGPHCRRVEVDAVPRKGDGFPSPQPGTGDEYQHAAVAQPVSCLQQLRSVRCADRSE